MPKMSTSEVIGKVVWNDGVDVAIEHYKKLKTDKSGEYDFAESQLNGLGYELIQLDRIDDAIKIFRLNQEEFSESANVYDGYGDALLANGDTTNSLINFKKAFAMDSTFTWTKPKIMRIEKTMTNKK